MRYRVAFFLVPGLVFAAAAFPTAAAAQAAPAWSRGLQLLAIKVSECGARAEAGLRAEGYTVSNRSGPSEDAYFLGGQKGIDSAIIACDSTTGGKTWVNVVVFSTSPDSGVPGVERQRLQARMNAGVSAAQPPVAPQQPVGPAPVNAATVQWTTTAMSYTRDPQHHHPPEQVTFNCPPAGPLIATGLTGGPIYTDDSPVCEAAVHAGLITPARGGTVTFVTSVPGVSKYVGSTRNGYTSASYDNTPNPSLGAFQFTGTATTATQNFAAPSTNSRQSGGGASSAATSPGSAHGCRGFNGQWRGPLGVMVLHNGSGSYGGIALQGTRIAGVTLYGNYSGQNAGTGTFSFTLAGNGDSFGTNFTSAAGVQGQYTVMQCVGP